MEQVKQSSTNISVKWALIYVVTSIVITYLYQFLGVDQASSAKYLSYIPFILFLILAQKECKDKLGGFITFGQCFLTGFIYAVFGGIILAVFIYLYLAVLSPHVWEQMLATQQDQLSAKGMSGDQIDSAMGIMRKYGALFASIATLFAIPIFGAIIALVGAAIFKKDRSILDIDQDPDANNQPVV